MTKIRLREYSDKRLDENMGMGCFGLGALILLGTIGVMAYQAPFEFAIDILGMVALGYFCYLMGRISFE